MKNHQFPHLSSPFPFVKLTETPRFCAAPSHVLLRWPCPNRLLDLGARTLGASMILAVNCSGPKEKLPIVGGDTYLYTYI